MLNISVSVWKICLEEDRFTTFDIVIRGFKTYLKTLPTDTFFVYNYMTSYIESKFWIFLNIFFLILSAKGVVGSWFFIVVQQYTLRFWKQKLGTESINLASPTLLLDRWFYHLLDVCLFHMLILAVVKGFKNWK